MSDTEEIEDELVTSHTDENPELGEDAAGAGLVAADDNSDPPMIDQLYRSGKYKPREGQYTERWDD